ncbi:MAG: gliding motility lipoprotein GldD [Bacteroidales bacterium]|nr:gliding motility lipoprotein GldD [Bacteroidales bacterium]
MRLLFIPSCPVATLLLVALMLTGCGSNQKPTPKPRGYFRIDLPEKSYTILDIDCPYSFEYPSYSTIVRDPGEVGKPCWINIHFPDFNGKIHISYKPVRGNLKRFTEDARKLAYKHTVKAEAISEQAFVDKQNQVYGIFYDLQGNVASPAQFYLTDSNRHFIRGSLYFRTEPNQDSLDPVIRFVKKDMRQLMETLQWQNR